MKQNSRHPRDKFITIFGRKPVLEMVLDETLEIDKILISKKAQGGLLRQIEQIARKRGILCKRISAQQVTRISKHGRQDQGIVADVLAPNMLPVEEFFAELGDKPDERIQLLAIDGVTTPANVGLMIRSAAGAGMSGVILPRKNTAGLSPMIVKASAGTIFKIKLLRCHELSEVFPLAKTHNIKLVGLDASSPNNLFTATALNRAIYVLGGESQGLSPETRKAITHSLRIPMSNEVESLNVACAATLVCFLTQQ